MSKFISSNPSKLYIGVADRNKDVILEALKDHLGEVLFILD